MRHVSLSPSELILMQAIWKVWNGKDPVASREFLPLVEEYGWEPCSYFSYLHRLEKKGLLKTERSLENRRSNLYTPLMTEQAYIQIQTNYYIKQVGLQPFFAALVDDPMLTDEAIATMQKILDAEQAKRGGFGQLRG